MNIVSGSLAVVLSALLIASPVPARPFAADAPVSADSIQLRLVSQADSSFQINSLSTTGLEVEVTDTAGAPVPDAAVAFRLPDSGASGTFPDGSRSMVRYTDRGGIAQSAAIRWNATPGAVSIRITAAKGAGHAGLLVDEMLAQQTVPSAAAAVRVNPPQIETRVAATPTAAASLRDSDDDDDQEVARSGAASSEAPLPDPEPPSVSITSASPAGGPHISKKWIILAAVAAAGVGAVLALRATGGFSSGGASSGVSIGSPTISVGHP